ncbi:MAG: hypothetical protein AAFY99_10605 [Pseudomonadota bacterium]
MSKSKKSKSKKFLKKSKAALGRLDGYEAVVSGAAKPSLWIGYASAINVVESLAKEGKSSKKTKKHRKRAIRAITKLAKHGGGKKALRIGKLPKQETDKITEVEYEFAATGAGSQIEENAAIARLIGTPDEPTNVVALSSARGSDPAKAAAPGALEEPLDGAGDDLQLIAGVGPKLEEVLHGLGIWHYEQIAAWGPEDIAWVDEHLRFSGRIEREQWVAQASALSRGGREEYVRIFGKEPR